MFQEDGRTYVIEGPEDRANVTVGDTEFDVEPDVLKAKFKKFIRDYRYNEPGGGASNIGTMKYRDQFVNNASQQYFYLKLTLNDLDVPDTDGELLAHCLKHKPSLYLPLCETALQELYLELVKKEDPTNPGQSPPKYLEDGLPVQPPIFQLQLEYDVDLDRNF